MRDSSFTKTRSWPQALLCGAVLLFAASGLAQTSAAPTQKPASQSDDADDDIVNPAPEKPKTPAELKDQAWSLLTAANTDEKHPQTRIQVQGALGIMGDSPRVLAMIRTGMIDKDLDVRAAAALAAGQTKSRNLTTDLRHMLDDKDPGVAFVAALTLWKMHDRSGEDILASVVDGERKTAAGLVPGTEHSIDKELHDPTGLAKFGAMQGAYMLLGPFGYGLTAYEYIRKNGGDSSRVTAIEAIAQNHTEPIRKELIAATADKDLGVRAAACKALARYHEPDVAPAIAKVFYDAKHPVRLTAAASYLVSTRAVPGSPLPPDQIEHVAAH